MKTLAASLFYQFECLEEQFELLCDGTRAQFLRFKVKMIIHIL